MWNYEKAQSLLDQEGRTREWLAKKCGVEIGSLHQILGGHRNPGRPVLILMAQALKTTVEELEPQTKTTAD